MIIISRRQKTIIRRERTRLTKTTTTIHFFIAAMIMMMFMNHRLVRFSHSFAMISSRRIGRMVTGTKIPASIHLSSRQRTLSSSLATPAAQITTWTRIQQRRTQQFSRCFSTLDDFLDGGDVDRMLEELDQQLSASTTSTETTSTTTFDNSTDQQTHNGSWIQLSDLDIEIDDQRSKQQSTSPVHEYKNVFSSSGRGSSSLYIKRDDLLRLPNSNISGNKGRKMWLLNFVDAIKFPKCIVSYGGPQSNSMVAIAAIVNSKNRELVSLQEQDGEQQSQLEQPIQFVYYTKKLPRFLKNQPSGNLFRALALGIQIIELSHQEYSQMFESHFDDYGQPPISLLAPLQGRSSSKCLWVPQGGAFQSAQIGVNHLAVEIFDYWKQYGNGRPLTVCVPGGTCTTAVLLHHGIKKMLLQSNKQQQEQEDNDGIMNYEYDDNDSEVCREDDDDLDIEVVVIPCVGDASYARRQMMSLSVQIGADPSDIPTILQPGPEELSSSSSSSSSKPPKYFPFGQPNQEILDTFQELQDKHGIVVDLIYGAPSFAIMFRHLRKNHQNDNYNDENQQQQQQQQQQISPDITFDPNQPLAGREIMYVHSGGLEGINSQLLRYKYEGMVEIQDVQIPAKNNAKKVT